MHDLYKTLKRIAAMAAVIAGITTITPQQAAAQAARRPAAWAQDGLHGGKLGAVFAHHRAEVAADAR